MNGKLIHINEVLFLPGGVAVTVVEAKENENT